MLIYVRTLAGTVLSLDVAPSDTVDSVAALVRAQEGSSAPAVPGQHLVFHTMVMHGQQLLCLYLQPGQGKHAAL